MAIFSGKKTKTLNIHPNFEHNSFRWCSQRLLLRVRRNHSSNFYTKKKSKILVFRTLSEKFPDFERRLSTGLSKLYPACQRNNLGKNYEIILQTKIFFGLREKCFLQRSQNCVSREKIRNEVRKQFKNLQFFRTSKEKFSYFLVLSDCRQAMRRLRMNQYFCHSCQK